MGTIGIFGLGGRILFGPVDWLHLKMMILYLFYSTYLIKRAYRVPEAAA
jgi:Ca2+/Na+ antiporter